MADDYERATPVYPPRFELDNEARAIYVHLSPLPVAHTVSLSESILVDYDKHGWPVGVEVL